MLEFEILLAYVEICQPIDRSTPVLELVTGAQREYFALEVEGGADSSTLSLTSTLGGSGWSTPRSGRFTSRKERRYPLYRRLGGPHGRSGRVRKISPRPGFDPRNVQPVSSRYTD